MSVQIQSQMTHAALDWKKWLKEGDQYFESVLPDGKKSRFGTDIRYNLLSMALESFIMAMMDFHDTLPDNHTYTDLIEGLERVMTVDPGLKDRILKYENIQSICSIEQYHRDHQPEESDIADLRDAVLEIRTMAHDVCCCPVLS